MTKENQLYNVIADLQSVQKAWRLTNWAIVADFCQIETGISRSHTESLQTETKGLL